MEWTGGSLYNLDVSTPFRRVTQEIAMANVIVNVLTTADQGSDTNGGPFRYTLTSPGQATLSMDVDDVVATFAGVPAGDWTPSVVRVDVNGVQIVGTTPASGAAVTVPAAPPAFTVKVPVTVSATIG